jgi:hypothetical protein
MRYGGRPTDSFAGIVLFYGLKFDEHFHRPITFQKWLFRFHDPTEETRWVNLPPPPLGLNQLVNSK